jgi:tetratricopeptide (TPR) repeat protein
MSRTTLFAAACLTTVFFVQIATGFAVAQVVEAEELRQLGRRALESGEYREAERSFRAALQKLEADRAASPRLLAETLGDLASDLIPLEYYPEAEEVLKRAIRVLKGAAAVDQRSMPILLGNLGTVYQLTQRTQLAERTFTEALRGAEKHLGADDHYTAVLINNLGALHSQMGKYNLAEKDIRKSLALAEKRLGNDSIELHPILVNLAATYEKRSKWGLAESTLFRSLALIEASYGDHPVKSIVLEHLATVHLNQKKFRLAEGELRRALDIERKTDRAEGGRIASISSRLAQVLTAEGSYVEAKTLFTEALDLQQRSSVSRGPEMASTLEQYALLLHRMRSDGLAEQIESRAKQIRAELAWTVRVQQ